MTMRLTRVALVVAGLLAAMSTATAQNVDEVLARYDAEPTVLQVQNAAAGYAQIDQGRMEAWRARAGWSALLPDLQVRYQIWQEDQLDQDDKQDLVVDAAGDLILQDVERDVLREDDDDTRISITGDFNLPELVWNADLLRISKETRDLVELREDIQTTVTSLYFERRRAQVQLFLSPPADPVERLRRELEIQELTASIDALTGGWFSAQLSAAGLPAY